MLREFYVWVTPSFLSGRRSFQVYSHDDNTDNALFEEPTDPQRNVWALVELWAIISTLRGLQMEGKVTLCWAHTLGRGLAAQGRISGVLL